MLFQYYNFFIQTHTFNEICDIFACSVTKDIFTRTAVQNNVATRCIATIQTLDWKIPVSSP